MKYYIIFYVFQQAVLKVNIEYLFVSYAILSHVALLFRYRSQNRSLKGSIASRYAFLAKNGDAGRAERFARAIAVAGLHQRFPKAGEAELRRHLADLLLGHDLARKVYGEMEENA